MLQRLREKASWWVWWLSALRPRHAEMRAEVVDGEAPCIHLRFSHPMRHIVLDAEGAVEMANELLQAVDELEDVTEVGGDADHPDTPTPNPDDLPDTIWGGSPTRH